MRTVLLATVAVASAFAAATAAQATTSLISNASASVSGGCACGQQDLEGPVASGPPLHADAHDQGVFGSVGNAHVITDFGTQKVSADAFWSPNDNSPDVQTQAYSEYNDKITFGQSLYNLGFIVSGTLSAQPDFGPGSGAYINWVLEDITHPADLSFGTVVFGGGVTPVLKSILVTPGDQAALRVIFIAYAYAGNESQGIHLTSDFSHTVHTYIDAVNGGPDVISESGHDYATPLAPGVPEPAAWALMLLGFSGLGAALRRRRALAA